MEPQSIVTVAVTGAAGQIGSYLNHFIGQGRMFGPDIQVNLNLIELPVAENALKGAVMELKDSAYTNINKISTFYNVEEGFTDIDAAILVGARPRGPGMERKDLLKANASIFKVQGQALDQFAKKTVKVLVVGNPANTNCLITQHHAPSIPRENFSAMTRLDHNRALS